jgi:hypothetical protein
MTNAKLIVPEFQHNEDLHFLRSTLKSTLLPELMQDAALFWPTGAQVSASSSDSSRMPSEHSLRNSSVAWYWGISGTYTTMICLFLIFKCVKSFFLYLLDICIFFKNYLFTSIANFMIGLFAFLLLQFFLYSRYYCIDKMNIWQRFS